jgi:exodeoxyribonuclease V alpha subunit
MEQLSGVVRTILFSNENNGYTVCEIKAGRSAHTIVGYMPMLMPGETVSVLGEWTTHPDYGRRFSVSDCKRCVPSEEEEMERYLSSGFIKGLGPSTAKKIVSHLGAKTFEIMKTEPLRLAEIKGITAEKALLFGQAFSEHDAMRQVVMLVQRFGVSSAHAARIWKKYGSAAEDEIRRNPFRLMDPDIGLDFRTCDRIAQGLGIEPGSEYRLKSAIRYVLSLSVLNGNTYCPKEELIEGARHLANVPEELILNAFDGMLLESAICVETQRPDRIYTDNLLEAERYCAMRLDILNRIVDFNRTANLKEWLIEYESANNIQLDENQKAAITCALGYGVSVITGGPGTGKTTIIKALIEIFEAHGMKVMLCAPTGRAAKRISEMTGYEAKTVHRLLEVEYSPDEDDVPVFAHDEANPLEAEVIIMDEASMIDIVIMSALLRAMRRTTRLVLVGDADQLPPVGPGKVLADIIMSEEIPVVKLDRIFRQSEESMIIVNAHRVNRGEQPVLNVEDSDFYFIAKRDSASVVDTVIELCASIIPERFGYDPGRDIQVLTPMRKGDTGVYHLNSMLQQRLNPPGPDKPQKLAGGVAYRVGDRIMQVKNDYNRQWNQFDDQGRLIAGRGVYNGDTGFIMDVDPKEGILTVKYDDQRICEYDFDSLDDLEHAFALTVHKSQGSEFPAVVIPIFNVPQPLVYRNLLYTAITRARKLVVIVGNPSILERMVASRSRRERYSGLKERLESGNELPR